MCRDDLKNGRGVFKRMYACLDSCIKGWKAKCMPITRPDGCFLKT